MSSLPEVEVRKRFEINCWTNFDCLGKKVSNTIKEAEKVIITINNNWIICLNRKKTNSAKTETIIAIQKAREKVEIIAPVERATIPIENNLLLNVCAKKNNVIPEITAAE